jgi:hypothetical protein
LPEPVSHRDAKWLQPNSRNSRKLRQSRYYGGPGLHSPTVRDQVNGVIAEDAFTGIILQLMKRPINLSLDERAIVSYLCKIGGHALTDEYRKNHGRRRPPKPDRDGNSGNEGTPTAPSSRLVFEPLDDFEFHDPLAADLDQRLCDLETYRAVRVFWEKTLANDERLIMERRHGEVPPRPYSEIAAELGQLGKKGEVNVRQRYTQAFKRTRERLRSLGLLDDSGRTYAVGLTCGRMRP